MYEIFHWNIFGRFKASKHQKITQYENLVLHIKTIYKYISEYLSICSFLPDAVPLVRKNAKYMMRYDTLEVSLNCITYLD